MMDDGRSTSRGENKRAVKESTTTTNERRVGIIDYSFVIRKK